MKNTKHKLVVSMLAFTMVLFNVKTVHTKISAPPSGGISGDPSRSSCAFIGCHPSPELSFSPGDIDVNMGTTQSNLSPMSSQTYIPGQTYYVEIKSNVVNGSHPVYGFQATSLDASSNMAGSFTITDAIHNSTQSLLGRNYIGHKSATSFNDWIFQWTAPSTNVGPVTFYYAVNNADGNGGESGDKIYKGTTAISPGTSTDIYHLSTNPINVNLFPNPTKNTLFVSFAETSLEPVTITVYDVSGKTILSTPGKQLSTGLNTLQLNLDNKINPGIYFLEVSDSQRKSVKEFVVAE